MAVIELTPGQRFCHSGGYTRVGSTATCVDTGIDWNSVQEYTATPHEEGPSHVGEIVGTGSRGEGGKQEDNLTFYVYVDEETGRFWYDNEYGF